MSDELLAETFDLLERFFALDLESKMDAHVQKNPAIRGYEPMGETKMDPRTKLGRLLSLIQLNSSDMRFRFQRILHDR